ncbi:MAG: indole-3-glycerol phosphate synthase TrpC [Bacteroidota bacterium]
MNILETILEHKRREVTDVRRLISPEEIRELASRANTIRPFSKALRSHEISLIAEIKKASPSRGLLVKNFDHKVLAIELERGGAQALSVLTDRKFFQGDNRFVQEIKELVGLPVLRKDFIIDEYQVYESKAIGADAILLIVKALHTQLLRSLYECATSLGLSVLVETHTAHEIAEANALGADIIGINNRDLTTFDVSLQRSLELRALIRPGAIAVSESGIQTPTDVRKLKEAGFDAVLVGERLVTKADIAEAVRDLLPH